MGAETPHARAALRLSHLNGASSEFIRDPNGTLCSHRE
jgi:hypothetical protein